jgi:hypothetical protein
MVTAQNKAEWPDYTALLDTNVVLDIYTTRDLEREYERPEGPDVDGADAVYRRARARESLLLAMYFNQRKALTYGLHHESLREVVRASPPTQQSDLSTHYTTFFVHFVHEELLPHWRDTWEDHNDEGLMGTECDDRLLTLAEAHSLPIITNEGFTPAGPSECKARSLRSRAKARGLAIYSPREFWAGKLDEEAAIQAFLDQFRQQAPRHIRSHPFPKTAEDSLTTIYGYYLHVLLGVTEGRASLVQVAVL